MPGPWEKFSAPSAGSAGPWSKFAGGGAGKVPEGVVSKGPHADDTIGGDVLGGAQKLAQGYTAGLGPKISAGMAAPVISAASGMPLGEAYDKGLADIDKRGKAFEEKHPVMSAGLEVAGAMATPLARGALRPSSIKAALTIPGMVRNAVTGAAFSATNAVGESRGDASETAHSALKSAGAGAALGVGVPVVMKGVGKAAGAIKAGYDVAKSGLTKGAQVAARELASQGIDVSYMTKVPEVAKGMVRGYFANTLVGGLPVRAAAARVGEQLKGAFDKTLDNVGKAMEAAGAGEKIHQGLAVSTRQFKAHAEKLYSKADELISPAGMPMMVKTDNLRNVLAGKTTPLKGLKLEKTLGDPDTDKLSQDILGGLKEATKKGRLTYDTIKAMRSSIGSKISNSPFGDPMQGYWKQLYAALSDDMTAAAKAAGPEAHKAATEASEFYKHGRNTLEKLTSRFGSKVETENVFRAVSSMDTLRNAPARIATLFKNLPTSARKTVGATVVKSLGQEGVGSDVNIGRWANNWSKIAPAARETLAGSPEAAEELNKLARNIARAVPLMQAVGETGIQTAGRLSDVAAAVNILNPVMWPAAIGKVILDAAGGWFLTSPHNIAQLNQVMQSGNRVKGASLLRKAADYALDEQHKQMMLDAADFLVRNRNGVLGMVAGDGEQD